MTTQSIKVIHQWAATGVSGYPLTHPIVGQGEFFETFRHFIHLVDDEAEAFAHVFAIIAQWGIGKSRLGYELMSQINGTTPGWWIRDLDGTLKQGNLFSDEADREQYLGLYIRYSQIANDYHNIDNWFAYGLYKTLLPLTRGEFDNSIQGQIAKEAHDRLFVKGFEAKKLAEVLEVEKKHSDHDLYDDPYLATRLCQDAYAYLQTFGLKYVLVVLDELETAAEASTYGLEVSDIKYLDGRAIKLIGKAIKEEDPRRKLTWLRYVALCSPAIGDELREIQSTARRFEMVELSSNAFADVSDFVRQLSADGRFEQSYPDGLVEAAYAMSGGNFGWFNVIMANVDTKLRDLRRQKQPHQTSKGKQKDAERSGEDISIKEIFQELQKSSARIREHVLDYDAIDVVKIDDRDRLEDARELLYGQLPVALDTFDSRTRTSLLEARNEYDEPIALLFRRVEWDEVDVKEALRQSKFSRDGRRWRLSGIDQPLDLRQLLSNLGTYAIHETKGKQRTDGKHTLLVPLRQGDFVQLVSLLYPHPASEDAARALWRSFISSDFEATDATHIGPSIAMIARLDLRHRKQGQTALVFRDPEDNSAHEQAIKSLKGNQSIERSYCVLTGLMRLLDTHWGYDLVKVDEKSAELTAIVTESSRKGRHDGGLVSYDALKLHPQGRLVLAWVRNREELERLCDECTREFEEHGRTPVLAFTSSHALVDLFHQKSSPKLKHASSYMMLYQLSSTEEHAMFQIGLPHSICKGFSLNGNSFTTAFSNRLQTLFRPLHESITQWRRELNKEGRIAWPMRSSARLSDKDQKNLLTAWRFLMIEQEPACGIDRLNEQSPVDVGDVSALLPKLGITPRARAAVYGEEERAVLFNPLDDSAKPQFPSFLLGLLKRLLRGQAWTIEDARREWFWGYTWEGIRDTEIFTQWMSLLCDLEFVQEAFSSPKKKKYELRTRKELANLIQEAQNWMKNDYPSIVQGMEAVFGEGRVRELFAPQSSRSPGTKTLRAVDALRRAQEHIESIESIETKDFSSTTAEEQVDQLCESSRRRLQLIDAVGDVYLHDRYTAMKEDPNIQTLNFDDNRQPLWEKIRRAWLFTQFVQRSEERIRARIESLSEEMRKDSPKGFPVQLFTLSLQKIENILSGAIGLRNPQGSTQQLQAAEPGTLRQYLRDLQVGDASLALDRLAKEVGLNLHSNEATPLEHMEGLIASGYRSLRKAHQQISSQILELEGDIQDLESALDDVPDDFKYPDDIIEFSKLAKRSAHIQELLEDVRDEEVERLRANYNGPAKIGNFEPLMTAARELFSEPKKQLQKLAGSVATLKNTVKGYLRKLLDSTSLRSIEEAYNALRQAQHTKILPRLEIADLEVFKNLKKAKEHIKERETAWSSEGEVMLDGATSFEHWRHSVKSIQEGRDPEMNSEEANALVAKGFIQRTYRLGGQR